MAIRSVFRVQKTFQMVNDTVKSISVVIEMLKVHVMHSIVMQLVLSSLMNKNVSTTQNKIKFRILTLGRFELFNFVTTVSTECLTVGNIKRRRSKAPATNARKNSQGRNEDETRALKYPGFQSQSTNGWNKYGCAGDDKCLGPIKQYWFRQPNGNKFCFTNYPSIELAQTKCRQFNSYWAGSCTHIASYRMYTGEYRWELLNVDAQTKCAKNFDSPLIQIDAFQNQSMNQDRRPR